MSCNTNMIAFHLPATSIPVIPLYRRTNNHLNKFPRLGVNLLSSLEIHLERFCPPADQILDPTWSSSLQNAVLAVTQAHKTETYHTTHQSCKVTEYPRKKNRLAQATVEDIHDSVNDGVDV
jgi:hypothetical protein